MGPAEIPPCRYTVEEYLALEVKSEVRHEFFEGLIIERPGDTATHNGIVMSCLVAFRQVLRGTENRV